MLQSRPVTAVRRRHGEQAGEHDGEVLVRGLGAAPGIGSGRVRVVSDLARPTTSTRATSSSPT